MKYVYEARSPRTLVLIGSRQKLDPDGFRSWTKKIEVVFGSSGIFILDDKWLAENGLEVKRAQELIKALGGAEVRLSKTLNDDETEVPTGIAPKTPKVIDGPASRENAKK